MKLGDWGEERAVEYLAKKGYQIVQRNFRCKAGEIDIIALYKGAFIFVEVKTRRNLNYGRPCESITVMKLRHLRKAIAYYAAIHKIENCDFQIDVLEILEVEGRFYVNHLQDIYLGR